MDIADLAGQPADIHEQAARLLVEGFAQPAGWADMPAAREEVAEVLEKGFAWVAVEDGQVLGWIGGLPEYDGRVWELHPLVVHPERRLQGVGRALTEAFEAEARRRGGLTATLGTDDDAGITSLAGVDLYADLSGHIARLHDLGQRHPFQFYQRLGYVVTGVMPDANGRGLPDIYMSKRL